MENENDNDNEMEVEDPRLEFMDMFEDCLAQAQEGEEPVILSAMVKAAIKARKELDEEAQSKLKNLETLKNYKQFLMAEYKPFSVLDEDEAAEIFSEYLLFTLLDDEDAEDFIDIEYIKEKLEEGLIKLPAETRAALMDERYAFRWGILLDD